MKKKYQTILRRAWCVILSCIAAVSSMAQEKDSVYREAVKELIIANWKQGSKDIAALVGFNIQQEWISFREWNDSTKRKHLMSYYDTQFVDDQTDIFIEFCREKFTLDDVKRMTADMPIISKMLLLTRNGKVPALFQNAANDFLTGRFEGFVEPEVSESFKSLCEQLYNITDMQKIFDFYYKDYLRRSGERGDELKKFYEENARLFFLIVCQKNATEEDLKACVNLCSQQPFLYEQLADFSVKNANAIYEKARNRYEQWRKAEYMKMTSSTVHTNNSQTSVQHDAKTLHTSTPVQMHKLPIAAWKLTIQETDRLGDIDMEVRTEVIFDVMSTKKDTLGCEIDMYIEAYLDELKQKCLFHYHKEGKKNVLKIRNEKDFVLAFNMPEDFQLKGVFVDSSKISINEYVQKEFLQKLYNHVQGKGDVFLQNFRKGTILKSSDTKMTIRITGKKDYRLTLWEAHPSFPGGEVALMDFLRENLKYPKEAMTGRVQGRVLTQFTIMEDGTIERAEVLRGTHPALDAEALRVVGLMPRWKPGYQRGKPVTLRFTLPITFRFQ